MNKTEKIIVNISKIFMIMLIVLPLGFCAMWIERDKTTDIRNYNKYFGNESTHSNDTFPKSIPDSAKVEDFCYYYYNSFDPHFVSYLVYTCNDEDFIEETERLSKLYSSKDYLVYGATGFNYPVSAVYADDSGYVYALADKENNKLIYAEINFCDHFIDINYEKIIDEKYLPINFDAKKGNSTQKKKHEEFIKFQEKNREMEEFMKKRDKEEELMKKRDKENDT
ncbi:hypothetical protein [uncultured Clostridium sp.]|uniref:hypothetical protein n=1 Tax=uncultured Clostridium sp. TaxID=59620 RepID=UPI0028E8150A|nr:hypothetical protein [uncultured Clostridium sp.]